MSKKSKSGKKPPAAAQSAQALSHNPFGNLAALDGQLPQNQGASAADSEPAPPPAPPERFPKKLVVRMEKKGRRGKTVTRIAGLPQRDLNALAVEMKKALGCGAMVEESEVVLQGSLVERAAAWLSKQGAKQVVKGN